MSEEESPNLRFSAMERKKLKRKISDISFEFLTSCDQADFIARIKELEIAKDLELIPRTLISLSFDKLERDRKAIADLIIALVMGGVIPRETLCGCMKALLVRINDLMIDVPKVVEYLEYYVNRFIDSKVLEYGDSKSFLDVLSVYSGSKPKNAIKRIVKKVFDNYFLTEQLEECCELIKEVNDQDAHPLIVKYCISLSLDRGPHERELVSRFFARIVDDEADRCIRRKSFENGLFLLLNTVEDLYNDVPNVYQFMSFFIARAIHDECLAPAFIKLRENISNHSVIILQNAQKLLSMENRAEEFPKIWDCNVEDLLQLKRVVKRNVEAFFDSNGDGESFQRFLHELGHPHFHHRVVFQLFSLLLDREERFEVIVAELIAGLQNRGAISQAEVKKGFEKIRRLMPDLRLDCPNAGSAFERVQRLYEESTI